MPRTRKLPAFVFLLAHAVMLAHSSAARADDAPNLWALIVSVAKNVNDSRFDLDSADNDAGELRRILVERGVEVADDRILTLAESEPDARKPSSVNLRRELAAWLRRPGERDRILVFYAGHGVLESGKTYLATRDFDEQRPEETGVPISELRKALEDCPAQLKCLVLDCCHAANMRSVLRRSQPPETLAKSLAGENLPGTVVLASSRANQPSYNWPRRRHGVFSYWLLQGLVGAAGDEEGRVTIAQLNRYVFDRTDATVWTEYGRQQQPVLVGAIEGDPVLLTLKPESPESVCSRMADHIDLEIRRKKLKRVAVVEFTQPRADGEGLSSANLPAFCSSRVRDALTKLQGDDYRVLDENGTKQRVAGLNVSLLGNLRAMKALAGGEPPIDALVCGGLQPSGPDLQVTCRLYTTSDGRLQEPFKGRVPLSEDLLGDLGNSLDNTQRPAGSPYAKAVIQAAEEKAARPHPLLDESFPFRVEVWAVDPQKAALTDATAWKRKEFVQGPGERSELLIGAVPGEIYEVRAWNRTANRVAMHLLVDGLNTLNQTRDRLGHGPAWVLDPAKGEQPSLACAGWYLPKQRAAAGTVEPTTVKRFQFVDAAESVAGRMRFGEAMGTITAAFYAERGRDVGTGEGPQEVRPLQAVDFKAGRMLAVVTIRYVDERELKK